MTKFRITQTDTEVSVFEVEAKDREEAEYKWFKGEKHIPEYDKIVDRDLEFEKLKEGD